VSGSEPTEPTRAPRSVHFDGAHEDEERVLLSHVGEASYRRERAGAPRPPAKLRAHASSPWAPPDYLSLTDTCATHITRQVRT
jgi:hypothetical protein